MRQNAEPRRFGQSQSNRPQRHRRRHRPLIRWRGGADCVVGGVGPEGTFYTGAGTVGLGVECMGGEFVTWSIHLRWGINQVGVRASVSWSRRVGLSKPSPRTIERKSPAIITPSYLSQSTTQSPVALSTKPISKIPDSTQKAMARSPHSTKTLLTQGAPRFWRFLLAAKLKKYNAQTNSMPSKGSRWCIELISGFNGVAASSGSFTTSARKASGKPGKRKWRSSWSPIGASPQLEARGKQCRSPRCIWILPPPVFCPFPESEGPTTAARLKLTMPVRTVPVPTMTAGSKTSCLAPTRRASPAPPTTAPSTDRGSSPSLVQPGHARYHSFSCSFPLGCDPPGLPPQPFLIF